MQYVRTGDLIACINREQQKKNKTKRLKGPRCYVAVRMRLLENTIKILYFPSLRKTSKLTHEQLCTEMSLDLHVLCWHHFKIT